MRAIVWDVLLVQIVINNFDLCYPPDKIKENGFELTKKRSRRYSAKTISSLIGCPIHSALCHIEAKNFVNYYSAKTITDADYIVILPNTPIQAETLLHTLEQAAAGIGIHVL